MRRSLVATRFPMPMPRLLLLALLIPAVACAQRPAGPGSAADEPRPLVVMNLAAHPDDEDGLTLAYYRHNQNAVAYSVIYTRGEGGQNEAGPELYERLGAIRSEETERAARILGTQVYFLNFYDFGFSKHADEAFAEWSRPRRGFWDTDAPIVSAEAGRDTVTARLVYLIRKLKPDVLFTNHDTTTAWPRAQHGQHQAVGISAYDAFALAADASYHPEHLQEDGVDLWQPQRLFLRSYRQPDTWDVAVPVGDACTETATCADLGVEAAAQHVSQGFDKFAPRFRRDASYFTLLRAAPGAPPLPDGATDLAAGLPTRTAPLPSLRDDAGLLYYVSSRRLPDVPVTTSLPFTVGTPGLGYPVQWSSADAPSGLAVGYRALLGANVSGTSSSPDELTVFIPEDAPFTFPAYRYQYDRLTYEPPFVLTGMGPTGAHLASPLSFEIAPPVVVDLDPSPVRLVPGENAIPAKVTTYDPAAEAVRIMLNVERREGAVMAVHEEAQTLAPTDTAATFRFVLPDEVPPGPYRVLVAASAEPTSAPADPYVETRPAAVLPDVAVAEGLRVGFVRSYDRVTEDALRAMGAEVVVLDSTALATRDLADLHTIVLDIRAYLVRDDLRTHNARLLDWVRDGGHLVVGYHKTFEWNPGQTAGGFFGEVIDVPDDGFAPYPLLLGRDRVTYEDAPVTLLQPEHVLFRTPHAIAREDWDGWVQERGLYFPSEYDARYTELLAMSDPGEDALRGGLLLAGVGAGTYLYSALGWYRQLEALNPGAWQLFANLVSLPLTDGRDE